MTSRFHVNAPIGDIGDRHSIDPERIGYSRDGHQRHSGRQPGKFETAEWRWETRRNLPKRES